MAEEEKGAKWWIRYVAVPLIGGGGLIGCLAAVIGILPSFRPALTSTTVSLPQQAPPKPTPQNTNQSPTVVPSSTERSDSQQTPDTAKKEDSRSGITIFFDVNLDTDERDGYVCETVAVVLSIDGVVFEQPLDKFHEHAVIEVPLNAPGEHNYTLFTKTRYEHRYVPGGSPAGFDDFRNGNGVINLQDGKHYAMQINPENNRWKMVQTP
jgi:hypothetical protein